LQISGNLRRLEVEEAFFFPEVRSAALQAGVESGVGRLLGLVTSARHTVDVCLFLLTLPELSAALAGLVRAGRTVRIIVDESNVGVSGSKVGELRRAGARLLTRPQPGLMHHKFIILDSSILLTGSFNWTNQAVFQNNENVVATSSPGLVSAFQCEFERLWAGSGG